MLGVVHQGVAFPLLWRLLDKRGNSNSAERIDLMEKFLKYFGTHQVAYLTADREFLGRTWVSVQGVRNQGKNQQGLRYSNRGEG